MPLRPCLDCGALSDGSRCPEHRRRGHWSPDRNRATQARFRRQVGELYAWQCAAVVDGVRCPVDDPARLQAHHTRPGDDTPTSGVLLCDEHHAAIDPKARVRS